MRCCRTYVDNPKVDNYITSVRDQRGSSRTATRYASTRFMMFCTSSIARWALAQDFIFYILMHCFLVDFWENFLETPLSKYHPTLKHSIQNTISNSHPLNDEFSPAESKEFLCNKYFPYTTPMMAKNSCDRVVVCWKNHLNIPWNHVQTPEMYDPRRKTNVSGGKSSTFHWSSDELPPLSLPAEENFGTAFSPPDSMRPPFLSSATEMMARARFSLGKCTAFACSSSRQWPSRRSLSLSRAR